VSQLDSTIATVRSRALEIFVSDEIQDDLRSTIQDHIDFTIREAELVQCVGMTQPVPLRDLYQPTRLKRGKTSLSEVIQVKSNTVIIAGPGQGKTTLLRHILLTESERSQIIPLFFTLRSAEHLDLLTKLVDALESRRMLYRIPPKCNPLLLLVDGYDEIGESEQKRVSETLNRFSGARVGGFALTCRTGYTVYGINCNQYELAEFDRDDAVRLTDAFAHAMRIDDQLQGKDLIKELEERKLSYIASHPLMLTLACVVKSSTNPKLPHNAVELLRQAMETLAFRWDEARGVRHRASLTSLLSIHMMHCVMRIAYEMNDLRVSKGKVLDIIQRYLNLVRQNIYREQVLDDIRRFFGLLETTPDGNCQFVHKTIHDYLYARYCVENGLFQPGRIDNWDIRAAYCTSLQHDATFSLHNALIHSRSIEAVRECLLNGARFDAEQLSNAVFAHFESFHSYSYTSSPRLSDATTITIASPSDFFDLADQGFLEAIIDKGQKIGNAIHVSVVFAFCLSEFRRRNLTFPKQAMAFLLRAFGSPNNVVAVSRFGTIEEIPLSTVL
jgi:hypothetical protein